MQTYVLTLACETCGQRMRNRVGDLTASPGDELVIDIDMAVSQTTFDCGACGGVTYLGDLDEIAFHEAGADSEDDEDEDGEQQ